MNEQEKGIIPIESDSKLHRYIQVQAHVAFSKANRNSAVEVEDYVAMGYEVLEKAKKTWKSNMNTKFNTYFTILLQRKFYHVVAASHRKKRGGAGNKAEDVRRGRGARWENGEAESQAVQHVSFTESNDDERGHGLLQVAAPEDNSADYELLTEQLMKIMPKELRALYKQMVEPDEALKTIAVNRADGKINPTNRDTACVIDAKMMADYLGLDMSKFRSLKRRVQTVVSEHLGLQY